MKKPRRFRLILAAALAVAPVLLSGSAMAFTDAEIAEIFKTFDANGDGKVDRTEFDVNKISIIYRNIKTDPIAGVSFEQTKVSRAFFDSLDKDHNGLLRPIEINDGLTFERLAGEGRSTFDLSDLTRFMNSVGR